METNFDLQKFLTRARMKQKELSRQTGLSIGMVGMMAAGKSKPSYETIGKLIECGMSAQELFGDDAAEVLFGNSNVGNEKPTKEDFVAGVREALAELSKLTK